MTAAQEGGGFGDRSDWFPLFNASAAAPPRHQTRSCPSGGRLLTQLPSRMPELTLSELSAKIDAGFASVGKRFDHVSKRFDHVDKQFDQVNRQFDQVNRRFGHVAKQFDQVQKRFDRLERSVAATDAIVTALYAELVGNRPNLRDRLAILETNVHKLIELTPSAAAELQQPVYDA